MYYGDYLHELVGLDLDGVVGCFLRAGGSWSVHQYASYDLDLFYPAPFSQVGAGLFDRLAALSLSRCSARVAGTAPMTDCKHPRLVQVENIEFGGLDSTTYCCEKCDDLLTVDIKPLEPIQVVYGVPNESK